MRGGDRTSARRTSSASDSPVLTAERLSRDRVRRDTRGSPPSKPKSRNRSYCLPFPRRLRPAACAPPALRTGRVLPLDNARGNTPPHYSHSTTALGTVTLSLCPFHLCLALGSAACRTGVAVQRGACCPVGVCRTVARAVPVTRCRRSGGLLCITALRGLRCTWSGGIERQGKGRRQ